MALGFGTMAIFAVIGLLPIRGLKGFGIKFLILALLAAGVWFLPTVWEPYFEACLPEIAGNTLGGGFLGPIGAVLGLILAGIMALVLKKKEE